MAKRRKTTKKPKSVQAIRHVEETRKNLPSAEHQSVMQGAEAEPKPVRYSRNTDLDPQLVWRGKDEQDWSDLVVQAPPLYIQEKVHPKALIDDLLQQARDMRTGEAELQQADLFSDFNGVPDEVDKTEFYQHDQNWTNRMILGDSLQVMASLAEREGLRGKVQCIYLDPPYGIKFNSNFQWSTTSRDVKDGKADQITREPEQVKAFRDTWRDGIHSYLTYLRDRLTVARDLLTDSGSIFVQIGDKNVHRVRTVMDEVFGDENFISAILVQKTGGLVQSFIPGTTDHILFYGRDKERTKFRGLFLEKKLGGKSLYRRVRLPDGGARQMSKEESIDPSTIPNGLKVYRHTSLESANPYSSFDAFGRTWRQRWKTHADGLSRLVKAGRAEFTRKTLHYVRYHEDFPVTGLTNNWGDTQSGGFNDPMIYVVQTTTKTVQRCILMATDPGDLVLDPTCGSGTTATVAEQWGRRWITIDTSRVALALARARIMGARYPFYLLADSREGQAKEAEGARAAPSAQPVQEDIRHGFVYERVPHITLKSIANNAEIDVIWDRWQEKLEPLREKLNATVEEAWQEWEIPREADDEWPDAAKQLHANWWQARIARQQEIDRSIAAKADFEYLYDKPYEDKKTVRVAGPFTVESVSPHRMLNVDEDDGLVDPLAVHDSPTAHGALPAFEQVVLDNLRDAGVQQASKQDKIDFSSLSGWPGRYVCAEGRYLEGKVEKRAGIFLGPEFGTVSRTDLVEAAREAGEAGFDVLIACAFNYEAHASEFHKLGRIPVLKARMNADLHMAEDLKKTKKGNLFVIFGEPDIEIFEDDKGQVCVTVKGVDVFDPTTGEVRSDDADGIACWFVDTDYNGESFFVRHAYFLGANDPYKALKTTLKAEIDADAWATLHSDTSRPFPKPESGRIAVKVINHLGDEVMKVFKV